MSSDSDSDGSRRLLSSDDSMSSDSEVGLGNAEDSWSSDEMSSESSDDRRLQSAKGVEMRNEQAGLNALNKPLQGEGDDSVSEDSMDSETDAEGGSRRLQNQAAMDAMTDKGEEMLAMRDDCADEKGAMGQGVGAANASNSGN